MQECSGCTIFTNFVKEFDSFVFIDVDVVLSFSFAMLEDKFFFMNVYT